LRGGELSSQHVKGAAHGPVGVLVDGAGVVVAADDQVPARQDELDAHATVVALAVMAMGRVDDHANRLDAIADALELLAALANETDQGVRRVETMKGDLHAVLTEQLVGHSEGMGARSESRKDCSSVTRKWQTARATRSWRHPRTRFS
jgi:hypothetical protein